MSKQPELTRTIVIPRAVIHRAAFGPVEGRALIQPIHVDWPELRLTEQQIFENAMWRAEPHRTTPIPHPDRSVFDVEIPYLNPTIVSALLAALKAARSFTDGGGSWADIHQRRVALLEQMDAAIAVAEGR